MVHLSSRFSIKICEKKEEKCFEKSVDLKDLDSFFPGESRICIIIEMNIKHWFWLSFSCLIWKQKGLLRHDLVPDQSFHDPIINVFCLD